MLAHPCPRIAAHLVGFSISPLGYTVYFPYNRQCAVNAQHLTLIGRFPMRRTRFHVCARFVPVCMNVATPLETLLHIPRRPLKGWSIASTVLHLFASKSIVGVHVLGGHVETEPRFPVNIAVACSPSGPLTVISIAQKIVMTRIQRPGGS